MTFFLPPIFSFLSLLLLWVSGTQVFVMNVAKNGYPEPAPIEVKTWPDTLSRDEMRDLLQITGWPVSLHEQALRVAWGESHWQPGAIGDNGRALGLFQLWPVWRQYCESPTMRP